MYLSNRGFTFIEMLITLTIIGMISTASLIGLKAVREDQVLKTAAEDFKSVIKLSQANAFASVRCNGTQLPTRGWKVRIDKTVNGAAEVLKIENLCIFANTTGSGSPFFDQWVKTYLLNPKIKISAVSFPGAGFFCQINDSFSNIWGIAITFDPVTGKTSFRRTDMDGCTDKESSNLVISLTKDSSTVKIEIDNLGRIRDIP